MSDFSSSISTKLVHVGRNTGVSQGFVNIPPFNGSTVLHHSSADMKERTRRQMNGEEVHGLMGPRVALHTMLSIN